MPCTTCTNNGGRLGCPCQEMPKDACPQTLANDKAVFRDGCTGEVKIAQPFVNNNAVNNNFDMYAVKLVPKKGSACGYPKQPCQERKCCAPQRRTVCYTCGDKRTDCYPADPKCFESVYTDAFDRLDVGQKDSNDWNWFTDDQSFTANDGRARHTKGGLLITCKEFMKSYDTPCADETSSSHAVPSSAGFLDHFKHFIILNSDFTVPQCGELYAEACIAGKTFGTEKHPFGSHVLNPNSDLRLAYSAFSMIDFESGLHVAFALTNDSIYALYERLPLDDDDGTEEKTGNASFAAAHLLGRRNHKNPMEDFARLGLALDMRKGAKWYVNGVLKHSFERLGQLDEPSAMLYQVGGEPKNITLNCVNIGFGLFTMLDAVHPLNNRDLEAAGTGLVRLTDFAYQHPWIHKGHVNYAYERPDKRLRLFGQGAALKVKELKVELRC